ncbi:DUF3164 family protein [Cognatishimia sp. MH4019]|uniref:DUF3164 family protein n=1 Tax=Cognatishimia sp. MH4019 TaxID=2854030 RepID=UPI001CD48D7E|nr:DUF3164 family protein [Cognatishimia sp. MH4019]
MSGYIYDEHGELTDYINAQGHKVPKDLMKPMDRQVDETVRAIHGFSVDLANQIARFRGHTHDDISVLADLLAEQYGVTPRGKREGGKGNVSFKSFDGLVKVEISVQDYLEYGPELKIAKDLIDDYIRDVGKDVPDEIRALLEYGFEVDKQGKVNRANLYAMRRLNITHPTFLQAMEAVADSQRIASSREIVRISTRPNPQASFRAMQINLANAEEIE